MVPSSRATSTSTVGLPRESRISRAPTASMLATCSPHAAGFDAPRGAAGAVLAPVFPPGAGFGAPGGWPRRLPGFRDLPAQALPPTLPPPRLLVIEAVFEGSQGKQRPQVARRGRPVRQGLVVHL